MGYPMEVKHSRKYLDLTLFIIFWFNFLCTLATMKHTKAETLQLGSTLKQIFYYTGGQSNLSIEIQ